MQHDRLEVFYDGSCALCRTTAHAWQREDVEGRLLLRPLQEALPSDAPDRGLLELEIHVRSAEGWQSGAKALLAIYRRLPRGQLMALIVRVGIAVGVAEPLYRLIARHRAHLPTLLTPPGRRG